MGLDLNKDSFIRVSTNTFILPDLYCRYVTAICTNLLFTYHLFTHVSIATSNMRLLIVFMAAGSLIHLVVKIKLPCDISVNSQFYFLS